MGKKYMTLKEKVEVLTRDFGLEYLLLQNNVEEEDVIHLLVEAGKIDIEEYFYVDLDEAIWSNED